MRFALILLCAATVALSAPVDEARLLNAIAAVETGNNPAAAR